VIISHVESLLARAAPIYIALKAKIESLSAFYAKTIFEKVSCFTFCASILITIFAPRQLFA
jgi:hypothetical protein